MFCVAFLLAAAVNSSPLNVDEVDGEILNNELDSEVQVDPLPEVEAEPEAESLPEVAEPFVVVEEEKDELIVQENENEIEGEDSVIDEQSESEPQGVPYEDEGKALQIDEKPEMTQEEKEKTFGTFIPMCSTHFNNRVALHLR